MEKGKYFRAIVISILIGGIVGFVTFQFSFSFLDTSTLSLTNVYLAVLKTILGYCFVPYIISLGIAGYRIERLRLEGETLTGSARSHSLIVNAIFWPSYVIIYYLSDLSNFGIVIGLGLPILGISLGILLFSTTISRIIAYMIYTFEENDGPLIRFGES